MTAMLEHALAAVRAGWAVLPIWSTDGDRCACPLGRGCASQGKHPINARGLTDATRSEAQVHAWWAQYPTANVGGVLRSSGFMAFDVDVYKSDPAKLASMEVSIGELPPTMTQRSGSGEGLHLIYRAPRGPDGALLDIKGQVGPASGETVTLRSRAYIVLAGSLHKSGKRYELVDGRPPAELPPAWVEVVRRPLAGVGSIGVPPEDMEPPWLRAIPEAAREAAMRAHIERERGEVKGRGRSGQAYDVARTCARGYAVRDTTAVFRAMWEVYNPRCVPPYSREDIARRVDCAYETAETPEWGERVKPWDLARQELGLPAVQHVADADRQLEGGLLISDLFAAPAPPLSSTAPLAITDVETWETPATADGDADAWPSDAPGWAAGRDPFARGDEVAGERGPSFLAQQAAAFPAHAPSVRIGRLARLVVPAIRALADLPVVQTPFPKFDAKIGGGLFVHSNTVIVASQGKGKSSLAGAFAAHHARSSPVAYYVGEMTLPLMMARIIGQITERSWADVIRGKLSDAEMDAALAGLKLYPVERQANPIDGIAATIELGMRESGCEPDGRGGWRQIEDGKPTSIVPMMIIDYIQLLADVEKDMRVSTIDAIRDVQKYLEQTVAVGISLSQTSRDGAKRIREGSQNSEELGDTGAETAELERSATNQIVLSYTQRDGAEDHEVTVAVTKARFGGGSKLGMIFHGRTGRWEEMDAPPQSEEDAETQGDILSQLSIHAAHSCHAGNGCMQPVNLRAFTNPRSVHKIDAPRGRVERVLRQLVDAKTITLKSGAYTLAGADGKS